MSNYLFDNVVHTNDIADYFNVKYFNYFLFYKDFFNFNIPIDQIISTKNNSDLHLEKTDPSALIWHVRYDNFFAILLELARIEHSCKPQNTQLIFLEKNNNSFINPDYFISSFLMSLYNVQGLLNHKQKLKKQNITIDSLNLFFDCRPGYHPNEPIKTVTSEYFGYISLGNLLFLDHLAIFEHDMAEKHLYQKINNLNLSLPKTYKTKL